MKIIVNITNFQDAISKCEKVIVKNQYVKSIVGVCVTAKDNAITVTATDFVNNIMIDIRGTIKEEGKVIIPLNVLKVISKMKSREYLTIENDKITFGERAITFLSFDEDEFPDINKLKNAGEPLFMISERDLPKLFVVQYAARKEDTDPVKGLYNSMAINREYFICSDLHRVSRREHGFNLDIDKNIIIPLKTIKIMGKIIIKGNIPVEFYVCGNKGQFVYDNVVLVFRLMEGDYINIDNIYPYVWDVQFDVNKKDFMQDLDFIKNVTGNKMLFQVKDKCVYLESRDDNKKIETKIEGMNFSNNSEGNAILINIKYVYEAVKNWDKDIVPISVKERTGIMVGDDLILRIN